MATVNLVEQEQQEATKKKKYYKKSELPFKIVQGECVLEYEGKKYIFGYSDNVEAAIDRYYRTIGKIKRRSHLGDIRLTELVQRYDEYLSDRVEAGDMQESSLRRVRYAFKIIKKRFCARTRISALTPQDFHKFRMYVVKKYSPEGAHLIIKVTRRLMLFAEESNFIQHVPMGITFRGVAKSMFRKYRQERGRMDFTREQVLAMMDVSKIPFRAMILLGVNCGFGNEDCRNFRKKQIAEWINYPRGKTHIERRLWLWPETIEALEKAANYRSFEALSLKPGYVFVQANCNLYSVSGIGRLATKAQQDCGINKPGLGFYGFRRTFATVASNCGDQIAVNAVMGHVDNSMSAVYRQALNDDRIKAAQSYVRDWLFGY